MSDSYFIDKDQLEKWIEASENIKEGFGLKKALGYLIGEKFYNLVRQLQFSQKMMGNIDKKKQSPDYKATLENASGGEDAYEKYKKEIILLKKEIDKFTALIKDFCNPDEIKQYFDSNPRLGAMGHICTEEEHNFFIKHGAVERSVDTEIDDALILWEMMKYLGCSE